MNVRNQKLMYVTGATGFLGRYVVRAALEAGFRVRAVVRPGTPEERLPWGPHPSLETASVDLRQRRGLAASLTGVDVVVHLAAAKTGDFATRFAGTVVATENLLGAMVEADVRRLVHCSTFSVYDFRSVPSGGVLDESTLLEERPLERDEYAQVKLLQEDLVDEWLTTDGRELSVLRPGLIYGPGELWHALLGVELIPSLWLGAGQDTRLPLAWVENVADAFVCAARQQPLTGATVNIVDDELPTVGEYLQAVRPLVESSPRILPLGYAPMRALTQAVAFANRRLLGNRLKLPAGLSPAPFEARFRPLNYSNAAAKAELGWHPRLNFPQTLAPREEKPALQTLARGKAA